MVKLHDIFSKSDVSSRVVSSGPSVPVIVDMREKQSLVFSELVSLGVSVSREKLEAGDFVVRSLVVERKSFSDFVSSILDRRLFVQLRDFSQCDFSLLIIENFDFSYSGRLHESVVRSTLLSITTKYLIPIIYTSDERDTTLFLFGAAKRSEKKKGGAVSFRVSKRPKRVVDQKRFILESFPGIGPPLASRLVELFGSLRKVFSADDAQLSEIKGFNECKRKNFFFFVGSRVVTVLVLKRRL
jgi:DNA excision repair protein ERCC-4